MRPVESSPELSPREILFRCGSCGRPTPAAEAGATCPCGGLFEPRVYRPGDAGPAASPERAGSDPLPVEPGMLAAPGLDVLGRFDTPLLSRRIAGAELRLKYEGVLPTGSYKDRGARLLVALCSSLGIPKLVEDSSGNAGAAIAAYAAALGIPAEIFAAEGAAPGKLRQIRSYGAKLTTVRGSREDVAAAAREAADHGGARGGPAGGRVGAYYGSHVYNPLFIYGVQSAAEEILRQGGIPEEIVLPVGNGALLLGLAEGFRAVGALPRFVAVQAAEPAPVWRAFHAAAAPGAAAPAGRGAAAGTEPTIADGVAVAAPARLDDMLAVIRESGGTVLRVGNDAIRDAQRLLGSVGVYAEPTGALATAGWLARQAGGAGPRAAGAGDAGADTGTAGIAAGPAGGETAAGAGDAPPPGRSASRDRGRETRGPEQSTPRPPVIFVTGSGLKESV